jgi:hypothetical protein
MMFTHKGASAMAENIGSKVSSQDIMHNMPLADGLKLFPGYNAADITKFVKPEPDNKCDPTVVINYLVDFSVVGTDESAKELLALAGSIVQVNPGTLTPTTVITVAGKIIDTVDELAGKRDNKGSQRFSFPVHLCCNQGYQPFIVTMKLVGLVQVQDRSPNDFVDFDVQLVTPGDGDWRHVYIDGSQLGASRMKSFQEIPALREPLKATFVTSADFDVVVIMNEHAHVDYDLVHPSISAIRVQNIHFEISTNAECVQGKVPPLEITPKAVLPPAPPGKEVKTPQEHEPGHGTGHTQEPKDSPSDEEMGEP